MSAYIVDKTHIIYLLAAALSPEIKRDRTSFRWHFRLAPGANLIHRELAGGDYDRAAAVGNMLHAANVASVAYRYPKAATLPGPLNGVEYEILPSDIPAFNTITPVQLFKACDCFEYQSCETPEWEDSEACAFIDALRRNAWHALPGYDTATWGAPEPRKNAPCQFLRN